MDGHLDTRLRTCAFEDHIKPFGLPELGERRVNVFADPAELLFAGLCLVGDWEAVDLRGKAVRLGKVKASLVNVDRDDACSAKRFGECAGEKTNRAHAKNKDRLACRKVRASGSVQ